MTVKYQCTTCGVITNDIIITPVIYSHSTIKNLCTECNKEEKERIKSIDKTIKTILILFCIILLFYIVIRDMGVIQ